MGLKRIMQLINRFFKTALYAHFIFAVFFLTSTSFAKEKPVVAKERPLTGGASEKTVTITSDRMEADRGKNLIVFKGNVVAKEDFTLCSDELAVRYGKEKDLSELVASGNVTVIQAGKIAASDAAVYSRRERTITLTGRPEIKECGQSVSGDKITINMDRGNALVQSDGKGRVKAIIIPDKKCESNTAAPEKKTVEEAQCRRSR